MRTAGKASRIVFHTERVQVIRFLHRQKRLCIVQLFQKIRPSDIHGKIIVRSPERIKDHGIFHTEAAVSLTCENIQFLCNERRIQTVIVRIGYDLCVYIVGIQKMIQRFHDGTFHDTDLFSFQCLRIRSDFRISLMLYQVVGLVSHCRFRIADQTDPVFFSGKACQQINLTVQQHLIQIRKGSVNIIVFPAGIFCQLPVIFIRIACLDCAFPCPFLKDLILIVADPDCFRILCIGGSDQ